MTMAAVLAEKSVLQLSNSFPEAAILLYNDGDHHCPIRCIKVAGLWDEIAQLSVPQPPLVLI